MDSACCLRTLYSNPMEAAATTTQGHLIIKYNFIKTVVHLKRQNCQNALLIYVCM